MKQANTDKVEKQSVQQSKKEHTEKQDLKDSVPDEKGSMSLENGSKYPELSTKDKNYKNQDEYIAPDPNKKSSL